MFHLILIVNKMSKQDSTGILQMICSLLAVLKYRSNRNHNNTFFDHIWMMRGHSVLQVFAVLLHYSPLIDISFRRTDEIRHFTGKITSLIPKLPISIFHTSKRGKIWHHSSIIALVEVCHNEYQYSHFRDIAVNHIILWFLQTRYLKRNFFH